MFYLRDKKLFSHLIMKGNYTGSCIASVYTQNTVECLYLIGIQECEIPDIKTLIMKIRRSGTNSTSVQQQLQFDVKNTT